MRSTERHIHVYDFLDVFQVKFGHNMCSERVLVYNISIGLGRVSSIYHGTVGVIKCYYCLTSYYDVCMRCLGDVSRGIGEVTRGFLFELSCCCGLERDTWMI